MKERQKFITLYSEVLLYRVRRVLRPDVRLRASFGAWWNRGGKLLPGVCRIFLVMQCFLDGAASLGADGNLFWVKPSCLCAPGKGSRFGNTKARYSRRFRAFFKFSGSLGDFAQVGCGPPQLAVVQVVDAKWKVSLSKLCASFDMDPHWHKPTRARGAAQAHCYHGVRVGHRFRWLMPPETMCETWGSLLHILHDDMANSSSWRLAARLFLQAAGVRCTGHPRDEQIVEQIAVCFVDELGKRPYINRPSRDVRDDSLHRARASGSAWQWGLDELVLGRDWYSTFDKTRFRASLLPSTFDVELLASVSRSVRRSPLGAPERDGEGKKLLRSLPFMARQRGGGRAWTTGSRDRLQKWLQSSDAAEWRAHREKLYGDGALPDVDPDQDPEFVAASSPSSSSSSS